ncbi:hypothetical protein CEUSTIGMA_g2641.t1 [Chlamydomonas eustigma]|uniref:Ketoreductase domain-containing protein n=1 Tax=Chlamydomonas eustigma TaxID=1157962 RepID=A0A250WWI5_9CHLO|nr:hypothetical protein CEUSTIGMA_g2641.t1 [Chlamydomonas eustigma]|eukprot:GAX75197.1 hypothetical protein CEUSTIGMA_g2641.t1 [Chlamydomonas eustigma]
MNSMATKRILVTGGNKGIGLAVCAKLLDEHPETLVLLGSRDTKRGQDAIKSLEESKASRTGRVSLVQVDVADKDSVVAAARLVATTYANDQTHPLYGIMNNAGIAHGTASELFQTNVYGAKFVVDAFLPLLDPEHGRIVNISSGAATMFVSACAPEAAKKLFTNPAISWEEISNVLEKVNSTPVASRADLSASLGLPPATQSMYEYGLSKACLTAYTLLLAKQYPKLVINACTPGFIETDLTLPFTANTGKSAKEMGMKSPEEGTVAPVRLMMDPTITTSGRYYGSDGLRSPLDRYRSPGDPEYEGDM